MVKQVIVRKIDEEAIRDYIRENLRMNIISYGYPGNEFRIRLSLEGTTINECGVSIISNTDYIQQEGKDHPVTVPVSHDISVWTT